VSVRAVVVVHDVSCATCSTIARELPDLVRVPVRVRPCRDPALAAEFPGLRPAVRACALPAVGTVRDDGRVRWWYGLTGAVGLLPVLRRGTLREAVLLLHRAFRARR
jgi:hypothetical protein